VAAKILPDGGAVSQRAVLATGLLRTWPTLGVFGGDR